MWGETWHALHSSMPADASSAGPICGSDLPKDSRQAADRWHKRNMRRRNSDRSATNLCLLTIVNETMGHNPNIRFRAGFDPHQDALA
jgi:hypothetical protein